MKKLLLVLVCLAFLTGFAHSADVHDNAGTAALAFLKIGVGARAMAMGDAYTALAKDANAVYWNPAGLAFVEGKTFTVTHQQLIADITYEYFGGALNLDKIGTVGVGISSVALGDIDETTIDEPDGTGKTLSNNDMAVNFSYGKMVAENLAVGGTVKYISETLADEAFSTMALDLGLNYSMDNAGFGLAVTNIGSGIKYDVETEKLPTTVKVGGAYMMMDDALCLALDLGQPTDGGLKGNFGVEYKVMDMVSLRAGYMMGYDMYTMTAGVGVNFQMFSLDLAYAPVSEEEFDDVLKFSVGISF